MARRYARDNRGRFAPKGAGATARGGRLKTASGKKRATQTMQAGGVKPSGAIKGRVKRDPGAAGKIGQGKTRASKPAPSAATIAQVGRERRATRNLNAAMKREGEGPNSKASRSASVAKRARAIYAGKVDPKAKTRARLTKTTDSEALRKRMKKMKDNNAAKAASKPAAKAAPKAEGRVKRLGSRIDPAKRANRKATAAVDRAMAAERKAMNAAMRTKGEFSSPARQKANRRLEDAQRETQSLIQTRRNIRAQFDVTTPNKPIRGVRPSSTISSRNVGAKTRKARIERAQANLARAENRRFYTGRNLSKTRGTARRALKFMANPRTAIQNRSLGLGFRLPRGMR